MEFLLSYLLFFLNRLLTSLKSRLVWINLYTLLMLMVWSCGNTRVTALQRQRLIGSLQHVQGGVGGVAILPCRVKPNPNPSMQSWGTVTWTRDDPVRTPVVTLEEGRYLPNLQDPAYSQRATLFTSQLSQGDISLRLSGLSLSDQGTYRCAIPEMGISTNILLRVAHGLTYVPPRGVTGVRAELLPDSVPEAVSSILWKHGDDKAAEWDPFYGLVYYRTFRGRSTLDPHTARLVVHNVTVEDVGLYSVEINDRLHSNTYLLEEMKRVPDPVLVFVTPCDSNSSSCTLHCMGDVTEAGAVAYRWRFHDEKWTPPKPNETRTYSHEEWSGPDSRTVTISDDQEGRKVRRISCAIKNWFSVALSEAVDNLLYRAPTARGRPGVTVTVVMYAVALVALIWNKKPSLTEEEKERERRHRAAKLRGLLVRTPGYRHITDYEEQLQRNMNSSHLSVKLGTQPEVVFKTVFTPLYNVDINVTDIHSHHEVRLMEMNKAGGGTEVQLGQMFNDLSGRIIRTVMTVGYAGIGKTFFVHKFMCDWAKKCFPQELVPQLVFPLKFRQLNMLNGQKFTLAQLIHRCITETRCIEEDVLNLIFNAMQKSGDYSNSPFKVMFVLDGYDENNMITEYDFSKDIGLMNVNDSYPVEDLLVNLIKGDLLPSARIWITSRPVATNQIPNKFVNRMTEVRGFITDEQKKEFFQKTFSDETQARSIFSQIKESKMLHTMCEIPVFCWILATVVKNMVKNMGRTGRLPKTMVELFCYFLMGEIQRVNPEQGEADKEKLIKDAGKVLLKLSKLAFHQLIKGGIIFYEKDLEACGIDVNVDLKNLGFCTKFFKEDDVFFRQTVYCFVHLSIQEFLAAVYLMHCFTQRTPKNMEVLKTFLEDDDYNSDSSLSDFLKAAMKKALQSKNGRLDLFVSFLHGLSLQSNQRLLGGLLGHTENSPEEIQIVINNLKEVKNEGGNLSPDRFINIFHCLMEMNDHSVHQEIQQYLKSANRSKTELSEIQCSALGFMLLTSEEVLEEFDLDEYDTTGGWGRSRILPAVRNSRKARLVGRNLTEPLYEVVASALSSNPSHLRELDLSYNPITDPSMDLLSAALKSPNCKLEILRLAGCTFTQKGFEALLSALSSNLLHLRELDLSFICLQESQLLQLSALLKSPQCGLQILGLSGCGVTEEGCSALASAVTSNPSSQLKQLDLNFSHLGDSALKELSAALETVNVNHGGEHWTKPQLLTTHFQRLTLDTNTANRKLSLSENNRKATRQDGQRHSYPDHPDRFDGLVQVLSSESLDERCYSEVQFSGVVDIGVTDRDISSKGAGQDCELGENEHSWSLVCGDGHHGDYYSVIHNSKETVLPIRPSGSTRLAVYLDRPAGTLSFYRVLEDTLTHLYTFQATFTQPLYAGFGFWSDSSSVSLCEDRQAVRTDRL